MAEKTCDSQSGYGVEVPKTSNSWYSLIFFCAFSQGNPVALLQDEQALTDSHCYFNIVFIKNTLNQNSSNHDWNKFATFEYNLSVSS